MIPHPYSHLNQVKTKHIHTLHHHHRLRRHHLLLAMSGSDDTATTSTTQPLLTPSYTPILDPPIASTSDDPTQYIQISYNYGPRSFKDLPFLVLFLLLVLSTFGFGIFACVHRNTHRSHVSSFVYDITTSSCILPRDLLSPYSSLSNLNLSDSLHANSIFEYRTSLNSSKFDSLHASSTLSSYPTSLYPSKSDILLFLNEPVTLNFSKWSYIGCLIENSPFLNNSTYLKFFHLSLSSLIWTLVITVILSFPFVFLVLLLLERYTKQIVYGLLPFFVIVPVFINVYWFVACTLSSSCNDAFPLAYRIVVLVFVFLIVSVIVWAFIVNWRRVELTVKIIRVASYALSGNLGLFGVLPSLTVGLLVYYVPIVIFLLFARLNGKVVPKDENGHYHCVWKQDSWVPAYYTLAILTMIWSAAAMVEAQVFVISGTIAQWYFSKDDSGPKRGIRSSLRNAFGPSSGTICLSGLLIGTVRVVRSMVDNAREDVPGMVNLILRCCVNALLSAVDFLNKFTIHFIAITGEAYCIAARMTYELLKRNLLSTVSVQVVSTRILGGIIFVLSAIYAIVVCVILKLVIHLGLDAYFITLMAWILLMVVLGFFVHVLDNVIDTVYICYAIDRDRGEVYKPEVHEVYVHLPISRSDRLGFSVRTALVV